MIRPLASFRAKEPSLGRVVTQFYFVTMGTVVPAGRASGCREAIGDSKGVFERLRTLPGRVRSAPITSAQRT